MKIYLEDIINRLSQFSEKLDNNALFIGKPWVLIDNETNYHKYIFKRNGELIMSMNGKVKIGKWEYIRGAKSLLIDRINDKILLNQTFIDNAVMILNVDGQIDNLFILADETIIPDLDVKKYLKSVTKRRFNIATGILKNGKTLEIYIGPNNYNIKIGMKTTIDGEKPEDGKYLSKGNRSYEIRDGKLFRITYPKKYQTINGEILIIEQSSKDSISVGDLIYNDNKPTNTGKYKIGFFKTLKVINGVVTKISFF